MFRINFKIIFYITSNDLIFARNETANDGNKYEYLCDDGTLSPLRCLRKNGADFQCISLGAPKKDAFLSNANSTVISECKVSSFLN